MPPLKIEQIKAPNLRVASLATARAGEAFQRATTNASDLLAQYQDGQNERGDAEIFQEIAGLKNEDELNAYLASNELAGRPMSAAMRMDIMNRRENVLGYAKSRADTGLVGANTGLAKANTGLAGARTSSVNAGTAISLENQSWLMGGRRENAQLANLSGPALDEALKNGTASIDPKTGLAMTVPGPAEQDGGVMSGFMSTVQSGGVQNEFALAAIAATGAHESKFSEGNVNRVWQDNSESGRQLQAGGIMSWNGPRLAAMQKFTGGDNSPQAQARFFLQENPELIQQLNNAQSVEEAVGLMNNAWRFAGYDQQGGEAAARLATAQSFHTQRAGNGSNINPNARTPVATNPNSPTGPANAALNNALNNSQFQTPESVASVRGSIYNAGVKGQEAIDGANKSAAAEVLAQAQLDAVDNPNSVTTAEVQSDFNSNFIGSTALETVEGRSATNAGIKEGGILRDAITSGTDSDPETTALAETIIEERAAEVQRSPMLRAAAGAIGFNSDPYQSLETALIGHKISTTPSDIRAAVDKLARENGITISEAAYTFAKAAEDPKWFDGWDNLSQRRANELANEWFVGDGAQEARQHLRNNEVKDREVMKLHNSVQKARARMQKSMNQNNGVADPRYVREYQKAADILDKAVERAVIPKDTPPPPPPGSAAGTINQAVNPTQYYGNNFQIGG